ncbi:MAG: sensor histidine kinase [Ruminococcus sp.]|nr:sensor histidine kinase [Ruminococcus sp.]
MNRLIDKSAILLICLLSFGLSDSFAAPVVAALISVGASALVQLFSGTNAAVGILLLSSAMCGVFPAFFCAFPLMLYDALCEKKKWAVLPAAAVLLNMDRFSPYQFIITATGTLITIIMYQRINGLETSLNRITQLRDKVTEQNMVLSQRNHTLAEAQDNEIRIATLKERNRIAREIHDNVGHMLTRSLLQAGALMIINKDENLKEPLSGLKDTLDSAMTSIRESVHDLHDDSVDLRKVIEESIAAVDERFTVKLDYDISDNISGKLKLCFAGIVKEGLSNAVKHSNGDRISILLREHPAFYQLMIEDNGKCGEIRESGIGLQNMKDRAASVNGNISFTPSEKGFRIFMSTPKLPS